MNNKNMVFVISRVKNCGPYNVIKSIIKNIDCSSNNVSVVSLYSNANSEDEIDFLNTQGVGYESLGLTRNNFLFLGRKRLDRYIADRDIDIVHSHGILPDFISSKITGTHKRISTVHCNFDEDYIFEYGKIMGKMMANRHFKILNNIDFPLCCSESIYKYIKQNDKVNNFNLSFVRNGIDFNLIREDFNKNDLREKLSLPKDKTIYLYAGALKKRKNVSKMIKEFMVNSKKDEVLVILGVGEELEYCKNIADDSVYFKGFVNNAKEYMLASDIYISFSKSEGLSMSAIEAMACGMTMLLSDIPSHRELVSIDNNYYVGEVFKDDFDVKKSSVCEKYKSNNSIVYFSEHLTAKRMGDEYKKMYSNSISKFDFSVLMAVYKNDSSKHLDKALKSVFNQTLMPNEVLLMQDGPLTEELYTKIEDFKNKYPYIFKTVKFEENRGLGAVLKDGVELCRYDLIARMDSDDEAYPERFEEEINAFRNNPELDIVGCNMLEFDENLKNPIDIKSVPETREEIYKYAKFRSPFNHPTVMFKKESVLKVGNYMPFKLREDYYLWARMIAAKMEMYNIQKNLLKFRSGEQQYKRRGGKQMVKVDVSLQKEFLKLGIISRMNFFRNIIVRFIITVSPNWCRKILYGKIRGKVDGK